MQPPGSPTARQEMAESNEPYRGETWTVKTALCPAVTVVTSGRASTVKSETVKGDPAEPPPAGSGLLTETSNSPPAARSVAGMEAWRPVALTNVVVRATPFHRTDEFETKFEPVTVRVNAAPPPLARTGEIEPRTGTGFSTRKSSRLDRPPPGARATIGTVLPRTRSEAGIDASRREALTNAVVRSLPSQVTTDPEMKPVPVTVRVKAPPPTGALDGERAERLKA